MPILEEERQCSTDTVSGVNEPSSLCWPFPLRSLRLTRPGSPSGYPACLEALLRYPRHPAGLWGRSIFIQSVSAAGGVAAAKEIEIGRTPFATVNVSLNANLSARGDLVFHPVLGGQFAVGVTGLFGNVNTSVAGTLTASLGPLVAMRSGLISDELTGVGDLYPMATLKWNNGGNNWMTYLTGDIPVGDYNPNNLSNIGIGHGAIDAGGGYTYLNPATSHEFSAVAGFTYNFKNPDTQYQNGVDFHFDWGASQFLSKQVFVGLVGYAYQQVSANSGQLPILGAFESMVLGRGPPGRLHLSDRKSARLFEL